MMILLSAVLIYSNIVHARIHGHDPQQISSFGCLELIIYDQIQTITRISQMEHNHFIVLLDKYK